MALMSKNGEYLRIIGITYNKLEDIFNIHYHIYPSESIRNKYDSGLGEYDKYISSIYNGKFEPVKLDGENSLDVLWKNMYYVLKSSEFKDWTDK